MLAPSVRNWVMPGVARLPENLRPLATETVPRLIRPAIWAALLYACQAAMAGGNMDSTLVRIASSLSLAWLLIRLVTTFLPAGFRKPAGWVIWIFAALYAVGILDEVMTWLSTIGPPFGDRIISPVFVAQAIATVALFMKVLWKRPGIGASEIVDALDGEQDWSPRTVKTLLSRLVEKGALDTIADGRRYLYRPLIAKRDYQKKEAGQLIDKLFGGRAAPLVAQLADARGLSNDDIEELEALLGRLKQ